MMCIRPTFPPDSCLMVNERIEAGHSGWSMSSNLRYTGFLLTRWCMVIFLQAIRCSTSCKRIIYSYLTFASGCVHGDGTTTATQPREKPCAVCIHHMAANPTYTRHSYEAEKETRQHFPPSVIAARRKRRCIGCSKYMKSLDPWRE